MSDDVKRFMSLFRGNTRSHGRMNPGSGKLWTSEEAYGEEAYADHLSGAFGLGIVPVMDTHDCWFGVIDIDAHGDDEPDIDLDRLEEKVREENLPLVVCRSRSGGAHLYLFMMEPAPAKLVRSALNVWAARVGFPGVEIFPKQDELLGTGSDRQLGNWINLCYFDHAGPEPKRYAYEGGRKLSLGHFLDLADNRRITPAILVEKSEGSHGEAPPCIQKIISDGVGSGYRNEALYNLVVYLKKAYPETWRDKAFDLNARIFDKPLTHSEAKKTIASAGRRDYRYKCKEEPCRSRCNSSICVKRKFGITPEEKGELEIGAPPEFDRLEKYTTDPVKWLLHVDGIPVTLSTIELMDFRAVRRAIADTLTRVVPPMKNDRWEAQLHLLMQGAILIEAPEEASTYGFIRSRLYEFFAKTDLSSDGLLTSDRVVLLTGSPVVQTVDGRRCVYFRGADFIDFLKRSRSEELKGSNLWMALRKVGVEHTKMRVAESVISVWYAQLNDKDIIQLPNIDIEAEL